MRSTHALALLVAIVLVSACAPGANPAVDTPGATGQVAGFWLGLWHGLICPITFIVSLFDGRVSVYEVHNSGGWYNFGFLLGASSALGGGGAGANHQRSRWRRRGR